MTAGKPCVLLVEDEPAQREILRYNLTSEGYGVTMAENGDDALLLADEVRPDLILLDWMLPGVSGIEVLRRLKTRRQTSEIPIIMISARSEEMDRVRGLETGADDYMIKPYSVSERVPAAVDDDGKSGPRLDPRTTARPRLGPRRFRRLAHRRCPCRPSAQGVAQDRRGRPTAHRARHGLRAGLSRNRPTQSSHNRYYVKKQPNAKPLPARAQNGKN